MPGGPAVADGRGGGAGAAAVGDAEAADAGALGGGAGPEALERGEAGGLALFVGAEVVAAAGGPQSQGPYAEPSRLQVCPPLHPAGPTHAIELPGTQARASSSRSKRNCGSSSLGSRCSGSPPTSALE